MVEWRAVVGYEGCYEVSNTGRVRSLDRPVRHSRPGFTRVFPGKELILPTDHNGYFRIAISKGGKIQKFFVHRLVASAFIPNPDNLPFINHIDGDPANNCISNLEWCTQQQNVQHAYANGLMNPPRGNKNHNCKIKEESLPVVRALIQMGWKQHRVAALFNVHQGLISKIMSGDRRKSKEK